VRPICWRKVSKTEARISLNNNKLPSANLVPLTPCLILVSYRNNSNQLQCVEKADENTLDAKNHQTFNIATNAILERKVRNWEISPTCDSHPQLINIRATIAHSMPQRPKQQLAVASTCASSSTPVMHTLM